MPENFVAVLFINEMKVFPTEEEADEYIAHFLDHSMWDRYDFQKYFWYWKEDHWVEGFRPEELSKKDQ